MREERRREVDRKAQGNGRRIKNSNSEVYRGREAEHYLGNGIGELNKRGG